MIKYIYDGTFDCFMTSIFKVYENKTTDFLICSAENYLEELFESKEYIEAEYDKSDRVIDKIISCMGKPAFITILKVFYSDARNSEMVIYDYIEFGLKVGKRVSSLIVEKKVKKADDISKRVAKEIHLYMGILRFSEVEKNYFYAPFEPDNNIVDFLVPHFTKRLGTFNWIMHDKKRDIAVIFDSKSKESKQIVIDSDKFDLLMEKFKNDDYTKLWKGYFNSIAIANRKNPGLQKQFMPRRYWDYLTEKF